MNRIEPFYTIDQMLHARGVVSLDTFLAQQGKRSSGWAWPAFIECAADSFRAYYRWVPAGSWRIDYTLRLNNAGQFELPAG